MDPIPSITNHNAGQSPPMTSNHTHPPYDEMIIAAITALKDKDGSSRQAISKYIEKEFAFLPPTHSTLLTHHLKRLKNLGQLVMVKHSYMLPHRSVQFQPPSSTEYHPTVDFNGSSDVTEANFYTGGVNLEDPPSNLSKRKPGRPPKLKPVPALGLHNQNIDAQAYDANAVSNQSQFQYHGGVSQDLDAINGSGSEPLFASLGLGDEGGVVPPPQSTENTPVAVKRGRGRPPKSAGGQVAGSGGQVVGSDGGGSGGGEVQMGGNSVKLKRGRGRPRRSGIGPVTVPLSGNLLRTKVAVNRGTGKGVSGLRRRGRPSRYMNGNMIRKPLGRPVKRGFGTAVIVTDPRQLVVYQELKTKYELLQSKAKQVTSMVKSYIDPGYGNPALEALQELENLVGVADAPSHG